MGSPRKAAEAATVALSPVVPPPSTLVQRQTSYPGSLNGSLSVVPGTQRSTSVIDLQPRTYNRRVVTPVISQSTADAANYINPALPSETVVGLTARERTAMGT